MRRAGANRPAHFPTTATAVAAAGLWLALGPPAAAESLAAIEAAEATVAAAWQAAPVGVRKATFVAAPPTGFGLYEPREDAVFAPGEPLVVYAEPVGYGYAALPDGRWRFGFDVDLLIKTADGAIIGGQEGFERLALDSRRRNREFMLTLTLDLDGAPAGDYVLVYTLNDITGGKAGLLSLPFTIAGD